MFDLELIATENWRTQFETICLLHTPCTFRQKSRQGKSKKKRREKLSNFSQGTFHCWASIPGNILYIYIYALIVICAFNGVYLRYDFQKNTDKQMLQSVLVVSKNKISESIYKVLWDIAELSIVRSIYFTINQKMTHYSDDVMKNLSKQKYSGILT